MIIWIKKILIVIFFTCLSFFKQDFYFYFSTLSSSSITLRGFEMDTLDSSDSSGASSDLESLFWPNRRKSNMEQAKPSPSNQQLEVCKDLAQWGSKFDQSTNLNTPHFLSLKNVLFWVKIHQVQNSTDLVFDWPFLNDKLC